jgi:membrane protein DedA with SNARE-associated domain
MKKKDFVTLVMSVVGGILFALGMCMGLVPEWNAMNDGIIIGVIGLVVLLAMVIVRRKMDGKPAIECCLP